MVAAPSTKERPMTKLTDMQLVILSTACQRDDRLVLPLPETLRGGAATKVVESLARKGFVTEVDAGRGDPVWRETGDGHGVTLVVAERLDAREKTGEIQHRMLDAAARRPGDRGELAEQLRDGRF